MHKLKTRRCRTRSTLAAEGLGWILGGLTVLVWCSVLGWLS